MVGLLVIVFSSFFLVRPLTSGQSDGGEVRRADLALVQVADLRTSLADFQVLVEPSATASGPSSPTDLAKGAQIAQTAGFQVQAVVKALPTVGLTGATARDLQTANAAFTKAYTGLAPLAEGLRGAEATALLNAERVAFAQMWAVTSTAATQLRQVRDVALHQGMTHLDNGRMTVLVIGALAAIVVVFAVVVFGRRAHRRERAERTSTRRQEYETSLQEALEMAKAEVDVYGLVGEALRDAVPRLQVEMLVADSSRAHFHQTLNTDTASPEERSGCDVMSPQECPATIRGHTLLFPTSNALNACPYLKHRASGECSAACIPISIAGKTVGVTHATGPDSVAPSETDVRYLEITSRRASERIAMLRAFEKSETQARSDPLTGLWNRRSLENQVRDLQRDGVSYSLAYGDLDHFKALNDTHGHEAGDQALRLFSRVLRDSMRPNDVAARYGGEEFVIVLPDCDTDSATIVLERVRERLALALTTGRVAAFTVSFGLASSTDADTFDEIVAVADHALLTAKAAGRNRVVVAIEPADHIQPVPPA
jgi:diguanylate cyclase (GGDEF)-like protein